MQGGILGESTYLKFNSRWPLFYVESGHLQGERVLPGYGHQETLGDAHGPQAGGGHTVYTYVKSQRLVHWRVVPFTVYQLYLHKDLGKRK